MATSERKKPVQWLRDNIPRVNIAAILEDEYLAQLAQNVVFGYDIDKQSRKDWEDTVQTGLDIVMQVMETKTSPWPDCANTKHPLIAIASIQFAARAYPEIVKGKDVVKGKVVGADPQGAKDKRAKRISMHMSWQLTEEMKEWEEDTDKLLHALPVLGTYYRKTYRDAMLQRNRAEGRTPLEVVVNHNAKDLETCRRVTDEIWLYKNEVIERERSGIFVDGISKYMKEGDDERKEPELFLEQHGYCDMDYDGYEEPYVITVHKDSSRVARIVARYDSAGIMTRDIGGGGKEVVKINPIQHFTKYSFIPSPDGKFHAMGFAQLLGPMNETMNTLLNQLLDAGSLSNLQSGFVGRGIRWQGGTMRFIPGEWKSVDVAGGVLRDNVVPLPVKEPSTVLFQLLGWLNDVAMRLASVTETMTGDQPKENTPATTVLAMIEQGLKVFTAIYKRLYRSLRDEYKKLFKLNSLYLSDTEYYRVTDMQESVARADYNEADVDVIPVADPTIASEAQRLARARVLWESLEKNPTKGGRIEILKRFYEALDAPEIEKLLPLQEVQAIMSAKPPPDPNLLRVEAQILKQKTDMDLAVEKWRVEMEELLSQVELNRAKAIQVLADAEAKEAGHQFEQYKHEVEQLREEVKLAIANKEAETNARKAELDRTRDAARGTGGVEKPPGNAEVPEVPGGGEAGLSPATGAGGVPQPPVGGRNVPADGEIVGHIVRPRPNMEPPPTGGGGGE